jgi:hypothetical protein
VRTRPNNSIKQEENVDDKNSNETSFCYCKNT